MTDAVLVEQCLNGRTESFAELVRRHQDSVFNLAYRMTNDWADAKDVSQETFLRAYRKLRLYRAEYAFRNWLLSICANTAKNRFRSVMRRRSAEQSHVEIEALRHEETRARDREMEDILEGMDSRLRVPLILKHVEGLSYEEISDVLQIGVSAAKMRVKRGRDRLRERLRNA